MIILIIQKQYTIAVGINSVIWTAIGTILGYYFGSKKNLPSTQSQNDPNNLLDNDYMDQPNQNGVTGTNYNNLSINDDDVNIQIDDL